MRVVVIGATGNVGTTLVTALGADDRITEIVGLARRVPTWDPPKTRFVAADITEHDLVPHLAGADAVVHLAWLFQPTHRPMVTWRNNVFGSIRVLQAVTDSGVGSLVYASSIGAYSPGRNLAERVDESWPTHSTPTAGYGREKAYLERLLDIFEHDHGEVRVVRLRPAFIFKRSSASSQRRLFVGPFIPKGLLRPGRLPILPFPNDLHLQALHSTDVADAYRLAVTSDVSGAFNVAADGVLDGPAVAKVLDARPLAIPRALVRAALAVAWHARLAPADPKLLDLALDLPVMDTTRARDELGWRPRHSAAEALAELLDGLADGAGGPTPPLVPD